MPPAANLSRSRYLLALFAGLLIIPACAGSIDDPLRFTNGQGPLGDGGGGNCDPIKLVATRCAKSGCHDAAIAFNGLDLETAGVAARVVDAKSTCQDKPLVDSVDIQSSYLIEKLGSSPACGTRMPSADDAFNAGDRACFIKWVQDLVDGGGGGGDTGGGTLDSGNLADTAPLGDGA